jgi:hypothetical protein
MAQKPNKIITLRAVKHFRGNLDKIMFIKVSYINNYKSNNSLFHLIFVLSHKACTDSEDEGHTYRHHLPMAET